MLSLQRKEKGSMTSAKQVRADATRSQSAYGIKVVLPAFCISVLRPSQNTNATDAMPAMRLAELVSALTSTRKPVLSIGSSR